MAKPYVLPHVRKLRGAGAHGSFHRPRAEGPQGTRKMKFVTGREFPPVGGRAPDDVMFDGFLKFVKGREFCPVRKFITGREFCPVR